MYKKMRFGLGVVVVMLISLGCAKEDTGIPYVPVEFQVFMGDSRYSPLIGPGGYAFVENKGVAGVAIYNTGKGYTAFDRCSTVNPEQGNAIVWNEASYEFRDPVSGGLFSPTTGDATRAPAARGLMRYNVTQIGPTVLRITN